MAIHSEKLMSDSDFYRWETVRAYHRIWLNQQEQGKLTWEDTDEKLKLCWALVWHLATSNSMAALTSTSAGDKKYPKPTCAYNAPAKPSMKACKVINESMCTGNTSVLTALPPYIFPHSEKYCKRKRYGVAKHV